MIAYLYVEANNFCEASYKLEVSGRGLKGISQEIQLCQLILLTSEKSGSL